MNRSELKNKVIQWSHRSDLSGQIDQFLDNTTYRLNNRLGADYELNGNNGENVISIYYPMIYIYGALREMSIYTTDDNGAATYEDIFQQEVSRLNITAEQGTFVADSPVIRSEQELEVIDAT